MDEPSAILDDGEIETLFDVVRRLTAEGVGVIYISHRLDEIRRIGDRVTVLADGRTDGHRHPGHDAHRRARRADGRAQGRAALPRACGRRATRSCSTCATSGGSRPCAASTSQVRAGEVVGLGGLVGSGRTELLRLIYGLDRPDEGEVLVEGKRLPPADPAAAIAAGPRARARGPQVAGARARLEPDEERQPRRPRPLPPRRCSTSAPERAARARAAARAQHGARRPRPRRARCSRAATSRRSCSRAGSCASAASCCSTSRRAASTSRPRPRSTGSSPTSRTPGWACSSSRPSSRSSSASARASS